MPTCAEMMGDSAAAAGCTHIPFGQVNLIATYGLGADDAGAGGICYGLSVVWLERKFKGTDSTFGTDAYDFRNSAVSDRSRVIYANQQNKALWEKMTGFKAAVDGHNEEKSKDFYVGGEPSENELAFSKWLEAAVGARYFLVHVPKHCMAAYGTKFGALEFFDPNGGIVRAKDAAHLAVFLKSYLLRPELLAHFKDRMRTKSVKLEVEKFKRA